MTGKRNYIPDPQPGEKRDMSAVMKDHDDATMMVRVGAYFIEAEAKALSKLGFEPLVKRLIEIADDLYEAGEVLRRTSGELTSIYINTVDQGTHNMMMAALGVAAVATGDKKTADAVADSIDTDTQCASSR